MREEDVLKKLPIPHIPVDEKQEILDQFSAMPKRDEEVLVISLGVNSVEYPGMLPEEKVSLLHRIAHRKNHVVLCVALL